MPDTPHSGHLGKARSALRASPIFALRELAVEQDGQQLLLSGTVSTFYQKQVAQEVVRSFANGMKLVNHVQVVGPDSQSCASPD
jgi:hypothetical protein